MIGVDALFGPIVLGVPFSFSLTWDQKYFSEAGKRKFPNRPIKAYVEAKGRFNNMANEFFCNSK